MATRPPQVVHAPPHNYRLGWVAGMGREREGLHGRAEGKKSQMVHRMLHKVGVAYSL